MRRRYLLEAGLALVQLAVEDERSPLHGADVTYQDGELVGAGQRIGFSTLLEAIGTPAVEAHGNDTGGDASRYAFHSFGAHFREVRVNRWTGEPRLSRITTVIDAGRIVNQKTARSQIVGESSSASARPAGRRPGGAGRRADRQHQPDGLPAAGPSRRATDRRPLRRVSRHRLQPGRRPWHRRAGHRGHGGGLRVRELPITIDKLLS